MNKIHLFIMCVCIVVIPFRFSLAITFPTQNGDADDFSSAFGPRDENEDVWTYEYDFHPAIDIAAPQNTNVYPILSGTVRSVFRAGNGVVLEHPHPT